jgi:predicted Rossmann fold nucleotide-binding protein DprA/Smf involved in DNA uptake
VSRERVVQALRLDAVREQTSDEVADAVCSLLLEPDEAAVHRLFERLDALHEQFAEDATKAVRSLLAELAAPPEPTQVAPGEMALVGRVGAMAEGPPPGPRERFLGSHKPFPREGRNADEDRILAILAEGPSHCHALASQLRRRAATVLTALHGLEQAGEVIRSQKTGRGTRWTLGPHGRP